MKLDMPKNTWLNEVSLDYFKGGYWNGVYGISMMFSGQPCPGDEFLAEIMELISKTKLPKRRVVRVSGLLNPSDRYLGILVKMLKDYGFIVQVILTSVPPLEWLNFIDWIIFRTDKKLIPMQFDELHYCPPETEEITEPTIPVGAKQYFLYLNKGYSVAATNKFICSSTRNWALL